MLLFFKEFLFNIVIISSPFVMYPYLHRFREKVALYRAFLLLLCSMAIMATMSFPVNLNGLNYDFRSVPLVIGSLYGGWAVALVLYGTVIIGRYITGMPEVLLYVFAIMPTYVITWFAIKYFEVSSLLGRMIIAVLACALIKLITFTLFLASLDELQKFAIKPLETIVTYLLQSLIVAIGVYLIEFLRRYNRIQDEVVKTEKMKLVSEIAASVAHEIRNPLTAVRGFIHLLGTTELTAEKKEQYKGICFAELDRAEHIISDYLSLARTDPDHVEEINLNAELGYMSNLLLNYANFNNIQLNVAFDEERRLVTMGDKHKFRQALLNIGKNAIEAMPDGGELALASEKQGDAVVIRISDTGVGMTAEQVKRLGTPYYSTKDKGTGLGTMVSFNIIKKMGGTIHIHSELNKGTTFTIRFSSNST
ncbi:HAMP domain-containing sensor histidine kinase [Paenibacillus sp. LHD-117]|uniref:HAMP domain-containing sensor histidine kinase n=1 Tax=Paenibacillus sp. LHD-117 TaxID=3071412 RepID=UPI0027E0F211|nr:HAMP domain-containing sensor histidine kinase [Paenibacillus sp. LHD-117]MDQ6423329.1 HAMP domain-containing sensor histidine kinase [Paenibacillus sp. LHD-117]